MQMKIELNDRLYNDILLKTNETDITVEDYLVGIIEDKFYTEKYGDLNIILNDTTTEEPSRKTTNTVTVEKDKCVEKKREEKTAIPIVANEAINDNASKYRRTTRVIKSK